MSRLKEMDCDCNDNFTCPRCWAIAKIEKLKADLEWEKDAYKEMRRQKRIFAKRARERFKRNQEQAAQLKAIHDTVKESIGFIGDSVMAAELACAIEEVWDIVKEVKDEAL